MPGAPSTPSALEAGVCPECSRRACRPSETHSCCRPHSSTTRLPTPNTSWRDSITSPTPCAGTRSPGFTASCAAASGVHTNGSSASHSVRARNAPLVRLGPGASISSRSLGREGGRLTLICRLCVSILLSVGFGGAPPLGRLLLTGFDLLLHARFGLLRLGCLPRLGYSSRGRGRAAPGESTTAQATRQGEQYCQASHMRVHRQVRGRFLEFTRPDRRRKGRCGRGTMRSEERRVGKECRSRWS